MAKELQIQKKSRHDLPMLASGAAATTSSNGGVLLAITC
jgi:hypothetical protein